MSKKKLPTYEVVDCYSGKTKKMTEEELHDFLGLSSGIHESVNHLKHSNNRGTPKITNIENEVDKLIRYPGGTLAIPKDLKTDMKNESTTYLNIQPT